MSHIGSNVKFVTINEYAKTKKLTNSLTEKNNISDNLEICDGDLPESMINYNYKKEPESHFIQFFKINTVRQLSMLFCYCSVIYEDDKFQVQNFLNFCRNFMSLENCKLCYEKTMDQSNAHLWFELRFGRITASIIYEASRCTVADGTLFKKILGLFSVIESKALERGKNLEKEVFSKVQSSIKKPIKKCGLFLNQNYPMLEVSPDGMTNGAVFEVKCPFTEKTVESYYDKNMIIVNKYRAQIQLQMLFAKKKNWLFLRCKSRF